MCICNLFQDITFTFINLKTRISRNYRDFDKNLIKLKECGPYTIPI